MLSGQYPDELTPGVHRIPLPGDVSYFSHSTAGYRYTQEWRENKKALIAFNSDRASAREVCYGTNIGGTITKVNREVAIKSILCS